MLPAATTGTSMGRPRSHSSICTAGARMAAPAVQGQPPAGGGGRPPGGLGAATSAMGECSALPAPIATRAPPTRCQGRGLAGRCHLTPTATAPAAPKAKVAEPTATMCSVFGQQEVDGSPDRTGRHQVTPVEDPHDL